ncbi:hypothetical protein QJQ45_014899, partial [Haematococcus lacustris]
APDRHTDLEKLHAPALDATSPASDSRRYLTSQRLSILTDTVQRPRHSAAVSQEPNHASAVRVDVARMAHIRLVFRGPLALTSAVLISLLMSASATVDVANNLGNNFNCNQNKCDGVQCVPVPGCDPDSTLKCLGNTACDNNATSCAGIPANTICFFDGASDNFKICDANTPFEFTLTSVSSVPVTNVTGSFRVRPCNADGNSCCNMDLNKVEFLSGDRCQGSVQAVFVNGVSRSWSWQIYGPGRFVFKITNLALSSRPGPNSADGVVLQIVLRPGSACPSFDSFFPWSGVFHIQCQAELLPSGTPAPARGCLANPGGVWVDAQEATGAPDRHTDLEKLHAPALDATSPASDSRRYLTSQRLSILTDTVQRPRHSAAVSQEPNHASAVRVDVARMAHIRLVFRGPLALTSAVLISLLMSASATVDVANNLGNNFNCNQNKCDGVQCVPVPGCDPDSTLKCLGNTACDNNATSCAGIPANTICFFDGASDNFKICDANTPFEFTLTSVSSVPVTNVTGSFRVRPCNADGNSCCNMDLNKVEFLSGDRCQGSVQAVFVNGVSRSWSWQIYGPGRFVFKITNLALSSRPGPNSADGVVLQIVLRPGSACPSFDSFFPGRVYSIFNARQNCCPVAPLRLPVAA